MKRWLAAAVLAHVIIALVHGRVHIQAHVDMPPAANLFVFIVILAGPLVGLAVSAAAERAGAWLIATTMAASLLFGFVNHFVLPSPDHVAHVAVELRSLFAITAVLVALTEALGTGLAVRMIRERTQP